MPLNLSAFQTPARPKSKLNLSAFGIEDTEKQEITSILNLSAFALPKTDTFGMKTTTPAFIEPQPSRFIGLAETFIPRVVTAVRETKEKGIVEAAKKFFDPREVLKFREEKFAIREQELIKEGKTPEEARTQARGEELIFTAIGATDAGGGFVKGLKKELQPLAQEARKYKSAEEFVNSQQKLYFGGKKLDTNFISEKGLSLSSDYNIARMFANARTGKPDVQEFFIGKGAKIINVDNIPLNLISGKGGGLEGKYTRAAQWAKNNGYDAVQFTGKEAETRIVNPDILKTKSQLTDFYNQAVKGVKEIKPEIPEIDFTKQIEDVLDEDSLKILKVKEPELLKDIPQNMVDFDKLPFEKQEKVFDFLPEQLQRKILGNEPDITEVSAVKELTDRIAAGKVKIRVAPQDIKTEVLENLGSANYARIFTKNKISETLDAVAEKVGLRSDELVKEISSALDRRGITNRTLIRNRQEITAIKLPALKRKLQESKIVAERKKFIKEFQEEITDELTRKRFSLLQKVKIQEAAERKGAKIGVQEFKRQERIFEHLEKDMKQALEAPKGRERSRISFIKALGEFSQTAIQDAKRQLGTIKPIREMNLEELKELAGEMKNRLKFKFERGFEPSFETAEKLRIQPKETPTPIFNEEFYKKNLGVKTEKPSFFERPKMIAKSFVELADRLGGSISTRLKNINPVLKSRLRKYEFDLRMLIKKDTEISEKLLEGIGKIRKSPEDFWTLDLALKNGDIDTTLKIVKKYGLEEEYSKVKSMLDNLWDRADGVGFDIGYQKDYWPRQIKDTKGFLEYLRGTEAWSLIDEAIKRKEMDLGRFLTESEKASLVNIMIRGYRGGQITLSKTGAMKERILDFITPELNKFYQDSDITLVNYIEKTNDAIEARKFFGKQKVLEGADKEGLNNIKDSIGTFIADLIVKEEITPLQELELRGILEARFDPAKTGIAIGVYKNLAYIDTLGSVVNSITQLGDLAFAMYKGGPVKGLIEGAKSVLGKVKITKEDIGFSQREISAELERQGLGGVLDKIFKITGFNKIDRLGAEGLINSAVRKAQEEALKNSPRLLKELEAVFPEKLFGKEIIDNVLQEFKSGEITDNVKFYAMNVLLDFSPRALSEMPEQYLRSGNGRMFYILKTWTLKLFDVYRNEVFQVIKENPKQGMKNMLELGILLFAMNATADEIKDLIRGRETKLSDLVVNNLAKLVGFSRYQVTQISKEGLASTLGAELAPPLPAVDNITKDVISLFKDFDKAAQISNLRTLQEIPIGGDLFYWWFGPGKEFIKKQQKKGIEIPLIEIPSINIPSIEIPSI